MQHPEIEQLIQARSRSLLGYLLDAAPVGASLAVDTKVVYANPECARMFGFRHPTEMIGLPFFTLIEESLHPFVMDLWHVRTQGAKGAFRYELRGKRVDGTIFPYACTSLELDVPNARAHFAFFEDLSDPRVASSGEELAAAHERLRSEIMRSLGAEG